MEITMTFDGIDLSDYFTILNVSGRGFMNYDIDSVEVPGKAGTYYSSKKARPRKLEVDVVISADSLSDLRKKIIEIHALLNTGEDKPKPIVFSDEENITYYGVFNEVQENGEIASNYRATLIFHCDDPYKYGETEIVEFNENDTVIVDYDGAVDAAPIFDLEVLQPVTFAMVANEFDEYNMVGKPAEVQQQIVYEKETVLDEKGDTLNRWTNQGQGTFVKGALGIQVQSYGTGSGWHGPQAITEIEPLEDFEIEFYIHVRSETPDRTFRVSINYFDDNMNQIGMLRLWDNSDKILRKVVEARVGAYVGDFVNYLISSRNYDLRNQKVWAGLIRIIRKGITHTFSAARITQDGRHVNTITATFSDVKREYSGLLKFLQIDISKYGQTQHPNEIAINRIVVKKINQVLEDQTPYIAQPGDVITFDHKVRQILINGENRKDLKDFGGTYFKLRKGQNVLAVHPSNSFKTTVKFQKTYG